MQVRERLLDPYFRQWLRDTEELLEKLPWGLEAPEQSMALSLTFERWLLQLKVPSSLKRRRGTKSAASHACRPNPYGHLCRMAHPDGFIYHDEG